MIPPMEGSPDPSRRSQAHPRRKAELPLRCRSFCFLEREGERWTVFLFTYRGDDGNWRGYFSFRAAGQDPSGAEEIRTADLFVEESEPEVDARARNLGRPLVRALLDSSLHTAERRRGFSPNVQRWFRDFLASHSARLMPEQVAPAAELSLANLRSLYDSYRLDQVAHLIALTRPDDFRSLVERVLDGREIDFRTRDRLQLAMMVVQDLERQLPLPPFEVWVEDYIERSEEYHRYTHALHRERKLP